VAVVLGEQGRGGGRIETGFVTHDKGELLRYFTERHAKGERLSLLKVNSTQAGLPDEETNVGLIYVLTRDAEDLNPALGGPGRVAFGKGGINGESRQLFAWSMEMRAGVKNPEGGRRLALRRPPRLAARRSRGRLRPGSRPTGVRLQCQVWHG